MAAQATLPGPMGGTSATSRWRPTIALASTEPGRLKVGFLDLPHIQVGYARGPDERPMTGLDARMTGLDTRMTDDG